VFEPGPAGLLVLGLSAPVHRHQAEGSHGVGIVLHRRQPVPFVSAAYQRGRYVTAFREATKRIEANPKDAAAMTLLGELYNHGRWPSRARAAHA
jgi:hypothetical protein